MTTLNPFWKQGYSVIFGIAIFTFCILTAGCGGSSSTVSVPTIAPPPPIIPPVDNADAKSTPKGIYHSAGILDKFNENASVVRPEINGTDYITGTLVKIGWNVVNPSEGIYDFSSIEKELEQAAIYDSAISLVVFDSKESPDYVLEKCETFSYVFRQVENAKACLPWDKQYQFYKQELIAKLAEKFDSNPNLASIYFTYAAMTNGIEMHWRVDESEYAAAGYTPQLLTQSYNDIMDMYAQAFKFTNVIMEIHSVFNESFLAESAFEHCFDTLGSRCGVAIWWCASRMATDPNESEYKVYNVAQQATQVSFAICQSIGSFVDSPERFDQGLGWTASETFRHEMDFFIDEGFSRFELWSSDVKDPDLVEIIKNEVLPRL